MQKNSRNALLHQAPIFLLVILWSLLIGFKKALGNWSYLLFGILVIATLAGLYLVTKKRIGDT
ncbi:MAG: hypothetical protein LBI11_01425 [Streptococcaceae bacterium]|nr:hypothetical protein [Streptococcaceae bacterium]